MIRGIRIANGVLVLLVSLGGTISVMQNLGDWALTLGGLVGIAAWSAPFYLAWRGLGPDSTMGMVRKARRVAILVIVGLALVIVLSVALSDKATSLLTLLPILIIFVIPLALNIKALGKRKAELDQTKAAQAAEHVEAHAALDVTSAVSTTAVSAPPSSTPLSANYFVRHWRGELSLPVSYWINGSVLGAAVSMALFAAVSGMEEGNYSLRTISFASLGVLLFSVTVWLWSVVGIWRSADHHVARGGSSGWASVARVMVVLGILAMAGQLSTNILPQAKEFALIAIGNDPLGEIVIKVSANGQSVIVIGTLREGSAAEVQKILDAAPGATSLVLNSNGGRLFEAQQLARAVRNRNLDTYVEDQCVSACTYVFLAGRARAATPNARIGFHQPSFPGLDTDTQISMTQDMMDVYRSAGLPEAFLQRIGRTSPEDMWYPTREELVNSNVITRMSLGGEAAMVGLGIRSKQELLLKLGGIPIYQAIEKRFPGTINEVVERAWAAKERGGNDADIMNAGRSVVVDVYPKLLKTADDVTLDRFAKLFVDQISAALAVSGEACAKLIAAELDITTTLPKEIVEQEQQFLLLALATPPRTALTPPDPAKVEQAIQAAVVNLPQQYINVVANMGDYANKPELVCDATIAFYRSIIALPPRQRIFALRGMFQGDN